MASIIQRNGVWQARIRRRGYPAESRSFSNRADAEKWARAREAEMDRGLYLPRAASESVTLADLADAWEAAVMPQKRAKTHFRTCLGRIRAAKALGFGERAIATITSIEAAAFRDELLRDGLSPSTVRKVLFFAASLIDYGIENMGLVLASNPFRMISRPSEPRHRERRLEGDEEARLREAIGKTRQAAQLAALFTLALETGARLGELLALRWDEIDLARQVMILRGREVDGKRQLKNADPYRYAPLSPTAVAALRTLPRPINGGRVFSAWKRSDSFTKQWQRVCATAGIEDLRFHDLRHEFASRMAPRVEMHVLMKLLGHKTPAMVARYYNQTADDVAALARRLYGSL
ncbi:MAG: site-specific integrase [Rhodocyclaceae bacterium]|nr:site-specific integrase [Rhodocyclaceae bacterium]